MSLHSSRSAFSAAEVLIASLAAALLSIPLLILMFQERDTGQRARFEYMALLAAREEMYEARYLAAAGAAPKSLEHPLQPLEGSLVRRLGKLAEKVETHLDYHPGQKRIETKLSVEPGKARLSKATILARWRDSTGEEKKPGRPDAVRLVTGLLSPASVGNTP